MRHDKDILPELPKGWVWTSLEEVTEINPKHLKDTLDDNMEVSFLPMKAIEAKTGKIDLSETKKLLQVKKGYTPFRNGDVLFAKITPCMENGKIAIAENLKNEVGFGSTEFHVLRPKDFVGRKLLFFFFSQDDYRKAARGSMTGTAGQLRVPTSFLEKTLFPLPPLPEQRRIVAKLEELFTRLDAGVQALRKVKAEIKRYRQAVLKYAFEGRLTEEWREAHKGELEPASVLLERINEERKKNAKGKYKELPPVDVSELQSLPKGWVWTRVGEVSEMLQYGTSEKASNHPTGIPVLRMGNIQDGKFVFDNLKYFPKDWKEKDVFLLQDGDVLFNRTNSSELVGKTAVYKKHHHTAVFASYLIRIRVNKKVYSPDMLSFFINSFYGRVYIASVVSQQVGQANVNGTKLSMLPIPLSTISEQHRIVEEIERHFSIADEGETAVDQSLKQAERLRQSILKRAFEGGLVPQDPTDEPAERLLEMIKSERTKQANESKIVQAKQKMQKNNLLRKPL